jgi:transcriptional regulator with XRE-family HTH domain
MIKMGERRKPMIDQTKADEIKREILARLRGALKQRGISLVEASERAELGEHYVSRISRGTSNPTIGSLIQVCMANHIDLYEIVLDEPEARKIRAVRSFSEGLPDGIDEKERIARVLQYDWAARIEAEKQK